MKDETCSCVTGLMINVVLDILFVYNFNMGVAGAAIETDIAQIAFCIAAFVYMVKNTHCFDGSQKNLRLNGNWQN